MPCLQHLQVSENQLFKDVSDHFHKQVFCSQIFSCQKFDGARKYTDIDIMEKWNEQRTGRQAAIMGKCG